MVGPWGTVGVQGGPAGARGSTPRGRCFASYTGVRHRVARATPDSPTREGGGSRGRWTASAPRRPPHPHSLDDASRARGAERTASRGPRGTNAYLLSRALTCTCALGTVHRALCTVYCVLCNVYCVLSTVTCADVYCVLPRELTSAGHWDGRSL